MKQKILTFMVCLLAGITAIHAQTESESSIVSFIKTADDWKVLERMSVSDNKGYQRLRTNKKRGYLVVELEATEINSSRIAATGTMPF